LSSTSQENESVAEDQGDPHNPDPNRRDFIHIAAGAAAVGAGAMLAWPLINSMNPAADTLALASIEFVVAPGASRRCCDGCKSSLRP